MLLTDRDVVLGDKEEEHRKEIHLEKSDNDDLKSSILRELVRIRGEKKGEEPGNSSSFGRRWTDDVVFSIRNSSESRAFINDSSRNEFHIKFIRKYIA